MKYFLGRGAVLDAGTFESERCYYAALTPEITEILRNYKGTLVDPPVICSSKTQTDQYAC